MNEDFWYYQRYQDALHAEQGGANFQAHEYDDLLSQRRLARCNTTGQMFDIGRVTVEGRYADCSVFRCPSCNVQHDDRPAWHGGPLDHMGYRDVRGTR